MSAVLKEIETTDLAQRQLITLNPVEYVAAVYKPFESELDKAIAESANVTYDIKTTAGMATAVELRRRFRDIRIGAEKERKARKAPVLEIGKLLDSQFKELEAEVEAYESRHDTAIKAEEAEKERIRQEKVAAENARQAGIQKRIDWIVSQPLAAAGKPSAKIAELIETLSNAKVDAEVFMEHAGRAQVAKDEALAKLEALRKAAADQEAESERLRLEREELDRQRKEQAERDRVERERRQAEEAAAKAKRDAEELALAQQRLALAEQQRKIDEAAAELKRQQEAHLRPVLPEKAPEPKPEPSFELTPPAPAEGPSDTDFVELLVITYGMDRDDAIERLSAFSADNVTPL